ncbi:MAG: hypothetical protein KF887_13185 [Paracoccaceae bacterium]|nr:MAG: hypothetical protein KF887_13185 [Paracoccaceae bacterium]
MTRPPQLILHIGAGKAGSTAIQFALKRNPQVLAGQNAAYVGLMLEHVPGATQHDWCVEGQPNRFFRQPPRERARVDEEVYRVIRDGLDRFAAAGVDRVVWSNEAFLPNSERIIAIIQRLARDGVPLRIVCYVRRHDKWARSAYVQFGLKGKMYPGPIRSFAEWVESHPVAFADQVDTWRSAFPGVVELYNVDAVDDAVSHFCGIADLSGIPSMRANEAPSNPLLAAYVVHNSQIDQPAPPELMATLIAPMRISGPRQSTVAPLEALLPTTADLLALQETCRADFDRLNALLAEQGQPPLTFDTPDEQRRSVTPWEMDRLLLQMVLSLQKQVNELKAELEAKRG